MEPEALLTREIEEWEQNLGAQFRSLRLLAKLEQAELAHLANVSIGAVGNLEGGKGTSARTMVKVLRALDHLHWLNMLAPLVYSIPEKVHKAQAKAASRKKVFRHRKVRSPAG